MENQLAFAAIAASIVQLVFILISALTQEIQVSVLLWTL